MPDRTERSPYHNMCLNPYTNAPEADEGIDIKKRKEERKKILITVKTPSYWDYVMVFMSIKKNHHRGGFSHLAPHRLSSTREKQNEDEKSFSLHKNQAHLKGLNFMPSYLFFQEVEINI